MLIKSKTTYYGVCHECGIEAEHEADFVEDAEFFLRQIGWATRIINGVEVTLCKGCVAIPTGDLTLTHLNDQDYEIVKVAT